MNELLQIVDKIGESEAARLLWCSPEFVHSWRPRHRLLPDGRFIVESGWAPSAGFVAAALAILRERK